MPEMEVLPWYGVLAAGRTPPELLERINTVFAQAVKTPAVRDKLDEIGFKATGTSRSDFARMIQEDTDRWIRVAKLIGFVATD
jgi:tripartite-type tricarboxylate transporter receptor subunit TctC